VAGELDFICAPAQARPIAAAVTGSRLAMLAGCGHFPSIVQPGPYRRAVLDFLAADRPDHSDQAAREM
jgi:pimeloyl-ACP methyl ester carboxylesterase